MRNRFSPTVLMLTALSLALALSAGTALAQRVITASDGGGGGGRCATPEPTGQEMTAVQRAIDRYIAANGNQIQAVGGQIKVAWHVIYSGTTGNIPQSQIDASIAYLNQAYSGAFGGVNTGYTFVLASVDRRSSSNWFTMTPGSSKERNAKQALAVNIPGRMNVYSCAPGQNLLGWAYFPNSYPEGDWRHGVVIHYGSVPGGYLAPYNLGGTLAHEVGHYLGLYHTFQGGCVSPGDYVSDTPYQATATSGCPAGKNTCTSPGDDPIHNYMDYSNDACYTEFTAGQDSRMDTMVPTYRPNLLNAAFIAGGDVSAPVGESDVLRVPGASALEFRGAVPNPFSESTMLHFSLPRSGKVSLHVYDIAGKRVATLVDGAMQAGEQTVTLDAGRLPAGTYFATLTADGQRRTRTLVLVP